MKCDFCERDMTEAESCTKNAIVDPDGDWWWAVAFGDEEDWPADGRCHDCGVAEGEPIIPDATWNAIQRPDTNF